MDGSEQTMTSREKYWSELTDQEKMERMRQQVKNLILLQDRCNDLENKIGRLETIVNVHIHADGKVFTPSYGYGDVQKEYPPRQLRGFEGLLGKPVNENEVYF